MVPACLKLFYLCNRFMLIDCVVDEAASSVASLTYFFLSNLLANLTSWSLLPTSYSESENGKTIERKCYTLTSSTVLQFQCKISPLWMIWCEVHQSFLVDWTETQKHVWTCRCSSVWPPCYLCSSNKQNRKIFLGPYGGYTSFFQKTTHFLQIVRSGCSFQHRHFL